MSGVEEEPPAVSRSRVDITVAGHVVVVDADAPLPAVAAVAKELFAWSADYAKGSTIGYALPPPMVERAPEAQTEEFPE